MNWMNRVALDRVALDRVAIDRVERDRSALRQSCWTAILVLSLLFAQFAGLQHRIAHAKWQGDSQSGQQHLGYDYDKKNGLHSCAVFDAATMADAVNATPCMPSFTATGYALAQQGIPASWNVPPLRPYYSRAPP